MLGNRARTEEVHYGLYFLVWVPWSIRTATMINAAWRKSCVFLVVIGSILISRLLHRPFYNFTLHSKWKTPCIIICFYPYSHLNDHLKNFTMLIFSFKRCWYIEQDRNNSNDNKNNFWLKNVSFSGNIFFSSLASPYFYTMTWIITLHYLIWFIPNGR